MNKNVMLLISYSSMTAALASSIRPFMYCFVRSFLLRGTFHCCFFCECFFTLWFESADTIFDNHKYVWHHKEHTGPCEMCACVYVCTLFVRSIISVEILPCLSGLSALCLRRKEVYDMYEGKKGICLLVFSSRCLDPPAILFFSVFLFSFLKKSGISTSLLSHKP